MIPADLENLDREQLIDLLRKTQRSCREYYDTIGDIRRELRIPRDVHDEDVVHVVKGLLNNRLPN